MTDLQATAFWAVAPGRGALRSELLPSPAQGHVVVRSLFSGISRGTESLVFHGRVPPSQYAAMRGPSMGGAFPFPVKYGYMNVGVIETGPRAGQAVFCLHPHQDRYVVDAARVSALPDRVPPARAILAANMETALNGVWDAGIGPGDHVTVVGAGVVGSLVAWLAGQLPATTVTLIDLNPSRAALASTLGVDFALPADIPRDQDCVVHASGSPAGLDLALSAAGVEATVLELSWYGDRPVPAQLGGAFHSRRLTVRSSQVGRIPPARAPRWTYARRLATALRLLEAPVLDALIDGESSFADLPTTMSDLTSAPGALCHRVVYPEPC